MAFLIPPTTPTSPTGDQSLWQGYEFIETAVTSGISIHQTLIQDRLNEMKADEDNINITAISTVIVSKDAPINSMYLTSIHYTVIGSPLAFPAP